MVAILKAELCPDPSDLTYSLGKEATEDAGVFPSSSCSLLSTCLALFSTSRRLYFGLNKTTRTSKVTTPRLKYRSNVYVKSMGCPSSTWVEFERCSLHWMEVELETSPTPQSLLVAVGSSCWMAWPVRISTIPITCLHNTHSEKRSLTTWESVDSRHAPKQP